MDTKIMLAIINSDNVSTELKDSYDYEMLSRDEIDKYLPSSDLVFDALCDSMTNLLCYKVSKEAYQRYSVRIHIINVLREWLKIRGIFGTLRAFKDEEETLKFTRSILEKYLSYEILEKNDDESTLINLTKALMCLTSKDSNFGEHLEKLILILCQWETTKDIEEVLCRAVDNSKVLCLKQSTVNEVYFYQKYKLIEEPLLKEFQSWNPVLKVDESQSVRSVEQLIKIIPESPAIFQVTFNFLKEFLRCLDYAPSALDFVQFILNRVSTCCSSQNKSILDLYPKHLQPCIILLRIEPSNHTVDSKNYTLELLKNISDENRDDVLMLLSHFPTWLEIFGTYSS